MFLHSNSSVSLLLDNPESRRRSQVLSLELQDLAQDYQAIVQELEVARRDAEEEELKDTHRLSLAEDDQVDTWTTTVPPDSGLERLIQSAKESVVSLHSTASIYCVSTSRIHSSLSRHSRRLSSVLDKLPEPFHETKTLLRASVAFSEHVLDQTPPLSPIDESTSAMVTSPSPPRPSTPDLHDQPLLDVQCGWVDGEPPCIDISMALQVIKLLRKSERKVDNVESGALFLDWVSMIVQELLSVHGSVRRRYLRAVDTALATQLEPTPTPTPKRSLQSGRAPEKIAFLFRRRQ